MIKLMLQSLNGRYGASMCWRAWADIVCWVVLGYLVVVHWILGK